MGRRIKIMTYTWLKCPQCGGEAYPKGPDSIDWCDSCGIVEGQCEVMQETEEVYSEEDTK